MKNQGVSAYSVVIIGSGQAGVETAAALRSESYQDSICLIGEEQALPYQRPQLSKGYLSEPAESQPIPLRGKPFFSENNIDLRLGVVAEKLDRSRQIIVLNDGTQISYDHLIFATGARGRAINIPGINSTGIHSLRTLLDAQAIKAEFAEAKNVVVVGAGFIGLEFANFAHQTGRVTVLEFAPRPMGRAVSPWLGEWFTKTYEESGIQLRLNEGLREFESDDQGRVVAVISTDGNRYPADLVVMGVGVQPNVEMAEEAELPVSNGISVDNLLRSPADPRIYAIGDCASFPDSKGTSIRLESVQNATAQARHVAKGIMGSELPYEETPWFWSVQGKTRLQIVNLVDPTDQPVVIGKYARGEVPPTSDAEFSVLFFRDKVLCAVESVNSPREHLFARKILSEGLEVSMADVAHPGFSLQGFYQEKRAALSAAP